MYHTSGIGGTTQWFGRYSVDTVQGGTKWYRGGTTECGTEVIEMR